MPYKKSTPEERKIKKKISNITTSFIPYHKRKIKELPKRIEKHKKKIDKFNREVERLDEKLKKLKPVCNHCESRKTGITQDGKSRYIIHKKQCTVMINQTNT